MFSTIYYFLTICNFILKSDDCHKNIVTGRGMINTYLFLEKEDKMATNKTPAKDVAISIKHFRMDFGNKTIIKDLSFEVIKGEVFGFLGSNGCGKTTTIRALLGLYQPTSGELLINGQPFSVSSGTKLGYLPEERGLYKKESVIDVMVYFGQLKGLTRSDARKRAYDYLERVNLVDKANTRIDKLSGGQQQKIQLGITIIDNPELLILDEPTKGFDPVNRRLLMNIVREHQQNGATIIFVTHQMEEVERLCDRVILLKDGVSYAYGTIAEIKKKFSGASLDDIFLKIYGDENNSTEENA